MKIIVTGASGFIGSWICRVLALNHEVIALVRPTSEVYRLSGIKKIGVTPRETNQWAEFIGQAKPDVLILAGWWGVGNQDRNEERQFENIEAMKSLALAAREAGVTTVIGVGSQAELGPIENTITEDLPDNPTTKYGMAKVQAREALEEIFKDSNTRFAWMRIFSTYGPLDTGAWLIPQTVDSLSRGKAMDLTKGEQEWSYLHAYDLARAFGAVVDNPAVAGVVNVGNPQTIILKDAVTKIAQALSAEKLLNFGAIAYREDQVMKLQPTCETLISIGWKPVVSFDSGVAQTIDWLKGQSADELVCLNGEKTTFELPARR
jgi:nucleoside-diphosphate-sugar epimerase